MVRDFSYWEYDTYNESWDFCIIGSGITGISTGISILEKHPASKVLIVDRWFIPLGASTRNAGFSCFGSPSEILDDVHRMGRDVALSLVNKRWIGLQKLRSRLSGPKVQYETNGGYELFHEDEYEIIHSNLSFLNDLIAEATGKSGAFREAEVPSGISGFSRAIYNPHEGQLHPGFMMEHLKKMYLDLGGELWTGFNVEGFEEKDDHIYLLSKLALPVKAKKVIVTTNAFAADLIPGLDVHAARNLVIVTEPMDSLSWKGCFHYDKGFLYFRNVNNRILLGGARNKDFLNEYTDQFGENPVIREALENFLYTHLAEKSSCRIDYVWSGIIAIGSQKLPIIRSLTPRLFIGVRCSGMGIALASLIGEELAELVLQQSG